MLFEDITNLVSNQTSALFARNQWMMTFRIILINVEEKLTVVIYVERNLTQVYDERPTKENVNLSIRPIELKVEVEFVYLQL